MIVYNAIKCNICKDIIESISRHSFIICRCGAIYIDGGLDYLRRGYSNEEDVIELSVHDTDDFEIVRHFAYRTGYGKPGASDYGTFRRTFLCDMSDEYLQASIDYVQGKSTAHWIMYLKEKLYRIENEISIPDAN